MKLVMVVPFTDGYTYYSEESHPIKFNSPEAALLRFEELNSNVEPYTEFKFCGHTFWKQDKLPDFYTIDEWFNKFCEEED